MRKQKARERERQRGREREGEREIEIVNFAKAIRMVLGVIFFVRVPIGEIESYE